MATLSVTIPMETRVARMRFQPEIWKQTDGFRRDVDATVQRIAETLSVEDLEGVRKAVEVGKLDQTYGYFNDPRGFFQVLLAAQGVRQEDAQNGYRRTRDDLVQGNIMIANQITISDIKADIGSIGGHLKPGRSVMNAVTRYVEQEGLNTGLLRSYYVSSTGDDISILMTHQRGKLDETIHSLAWNAFLTGTEVARQEGHYGAGQDLLVDAPSGNVKGAGPAVAELEFVERKVEPFLDIGADKTSPGAFSLPLYLLSDPMYNAGLILADNAKPGYTYRVLDLSHKGGEDKAIYLSTTEDLYDLALLLRDADNFVIEAMYLKATGEQFVSVSATRLHDIAGKYTGKDDPRMLVRLQGAFPATGEVLHPYSMAPLVPGFMRGSHNGPLMPVTQNGVVSWFDGPPVVTAAAFSVKNGLLTEPADTFDQPFWDAVREEVAQKAQWIRRQGFFGAAMLPWQELEYSAGPVKKMNALQSRFRFEKES
ncbi:MAG: fructose 1,6-bisphosphatase [Syntrophobacteria bacterium]